MKIVKWLFGDKDLFFFYKFNIVVLKIVQNFKLFFTYL